MLTTFQVIVPVIGILITMSVPLVRYAVRERHEQAAVEWMRRIQDAQRELLQTSGGYASAITSLTVPCQRTPRSLPADIVQELASVGYVLELRPSRESDVTGRECHGHDLVSDYYLALIPATVTTPARQAFASRGDGRVQLFYDRLPPRESELETGLGTPAEARETFKIP